MVTKTDGQREAAIRVAEGEKQAAIPQADGERAAQVLRAFPLEFTSLLGSLRREPLAE